MKAEPQQGDVRMTEDLTHAETAVWAATERSADLSAPPVGEGTATTVRRRKAIAVLGAAGVIGPIVFTAAFMIQGLFRADEYDPVAETISALEAGPGGWIQQVNFIVFGLLTIAFALGLQFGMRPVRAGWIGPAILSLSGLALFWAAAFPIREDASGVTLPPGMHLVGGAIYFSTAAVGLVVLSRRMARDPAWRDLAAYTLAAGAAGVAGFIAINILVRPDSAPLHAWYGLAQRALLLLVLFPPTIILALRLLRVSRTGEALEGWPPARTAALDPPRQTVESPRETRAMGASHAGHIRGSGPGTPRWVKVFGVIALVLAFLFAVVAITGIGGPHGPARHMSSGGGASGVTELPARQQP